MSTKVPQIGEVRGTARICTGKSRAPVYSLHVILQVRCTIKLFATVGLGADERALHIDHTHTHTQMKQHTASRASTLYSIQHYTERNA